MIPIGLYVVPVWLGFLVSLWLIQRVGLPLTTLGRVVLAVASCSFLFTVGVVSMSVLANAEVSRAVASVAAICVANTAGFFIWLTTYPTPLFEGYSAIFSKHPHIRDAARRRVRVSRANRK